MPEGARCVLGPRRVPTLREGAEERGPAYHRRDLPAGHQGAPEARRFAKDGYTIVLVGHDGHEEVEGTMGEAPDRIVLVQSEQDVDGSR